jgi:sporulation protein YlmC with PRC-barrel domain
VDHVVLVIVANLLTILVKKGVEIGATLGVTLDARLGIKTTAIEGVEKRHLFFSKKNRFVSVPTRKNVKNVVIKMN